MNHCIPLLVTVCDKFTERIRFQWGWVHRRKECSGGVFAIDGTLWDRTTWRTIIWVGGYPQTVFVAFPAPLLHFPYTVSKPLQLCLHLLFLFYASSSSIPHPIYNRKYHPHPIHIPKSHSSSPLSSHLSHQLWSRTCDNIHDSNHSSPYSPTPTSYAPHPIEYN